jgi:DNA-binding CsgD family transcriptional regulator/PAS domain-containing protein
MANATTQTEIPLASFSKVVEAVYDCALDTTRWHDTVRLIADLCASQICLLGVYDYQTRCGELTYQHGQSEHWIRLHEEKYRDFDPLFVAGQLVPVGVVKTQAMLIPDDEFQETRFYREWVRPQGLLDMISFAVLRTDHRLGWLCANRRDTCPRYGDAEVRLLTLLAPHVCRSIAISDALNLKTIRSEALEATLNALASGVYLTDRYGRVVFMNGAAERQAKTSYALRIENNRLAPVDRAARVAINKAIADATTNEATTPAAGVSLALPAGEETGLIATILPLSRGERLNVCGAFAASAAVFVQDPVVVPPFPGEAFAKLYSLTGGELRVLLAMAPGLGVKEAAEVLGISEATARTHVQHIYDKTGTSRQTELMQLFMSATPPVKVA